MSINKQAILDAQDLKTEPVDVPEWGGTVYVRTMTGAERDLFESTLMKGEGKNRKVDSANIRARLSCLCLVDESGERLFSDDEAERLGKKSADVLDRVFSVAQRLNGLSEKDVEELAKNSAAAPSGDSSLDSASR
jgi:hypothetical protein